MKKRIGFQLFFLTFLLCCIIIAVIFIGQFFIIEYLYADKEKMYIQNQLKQYYKSYYTYTQNEKLLQDIELSIFKEEGIMIARLDKEANIKSLPSGEYYIKVTNKNDQTKESKIVFNNLINARKDIDYNFNIIVTSLINKNTKVVFMDTVSKGIKKEVVVPTSMRIGGYDGTFVAPTYYQINENITSDVKSGVKHFTKQESDKFLYLEGLVTQLSFPFYSTPGMNNTLYHNEIFANRILQFQSDWITDKVNFKIDEWNQNEISIDGIQYIETFKPIIKDGEVQELIYTLTSLQPITKVTSFMEDYYVYIILIVLLLALIACIIYSKIITKPLLKINSITKKIMEFKFDEKLDIKSENEIGELSQNINQLSKRMESYIKKLEADIEKERKLEKVRKDFIAGVSHELKTPLSVMQISTSMLQDGIAPEKNEYYLNTIENEIEKMNGIIKEMLSLAKYESGTYKIAMKPVNITWLIEKVCEKLQYQVEEKGLNVIINLNETGIKGSECLLEQVVTNLFTNAIKYTEPKNSIILDLKEQNEVVYFGIENTGAHLSEYDLERIWDQFYRVDASRNRENNSTGLGLPIVKKILDLHGANYGVKNTIHGVKFYIYFNKV